MSKPELQELHDHYWNLLEEKGFSLGQRLKLRSTFVDWSGYKEEYPFIERTFKGGDVEYYHSTYELIKNFMFKTENEVILANAIYLNMNEMCGTSEFRELFKYTCRIIGLNTNWD